jgi:hypothetical protein
MSIRLVVVRRVDGGSETRGHRVQRSPTMQYLILIYDTESATPSPEPPDPAVWAQVMGDYNAYTAMLRDTGAYIAGEALHNVTTATTLRTDASGQIVTTDGPFAETKEALGGFYLVEAKDLDAALALGAACPGVKFGSIEVRPVIDLSGAPADAPVGAAAAD